MYQNLKEESSQMISSTGSIRLNRCSNIKKVSNEKKVKIVALKLKKYASAWWKQLKVCQERMGKPKITSWEKMKKELRKKFLPENYLQ